jgi:hypothetical protein
VEVNSFQLDAHLLDLLHSFVYLAGSVNVISKLPRKCSKLLVRIVLFDGNPPQDAHARSQLLNFYELVDGVCGRESHSILFCPGKIALILHWVGVDNGFDVSSDAEHSLYFSPGGAIKA